VPVSHATILTGLTRPVMQQVQNHWLQPAAAAAFIQMQQAAATAGISMAIASSYRDFASQARIWQAKLAGHRPVFDGSGQRVDLNLLDDRAKLYAILHFSALPGTSRHHWGTDLDVFDQAAIPSDYQLQLSPSEYASGGPFFKLAQWLSQHAANYGFFRPYRKYLGGVAMEPWHLSYRPLATKLMADLTTQQVLAASQSQQLFSYDLLATEISEIMQRYVFNISEGSDE
jgi:LAS superfamily LD-carboxypeptidase LdcB